MTSGKTLVTVCGATDVGHVREDNEDAFAIGDVSSETVAAPTEPQAVPLSSEGVLLVVCDGMGGAAAGEVAARLACESLVHVFFERQREEGIGGGEALSSALRLANRVIFDESRRERDQRGMGTTCTAALVTPGHLVVGQIGDSRAYLFRRGNLRQLTKDQSLAMAMVDSGALAPTEIKDFPHGNVILQALGVQDDVTPVISEIDLQPEDTLLLCTDGLHGPVPQDEIAAIVHGTEHLSACARSLIHAALEAGGPDNVTVVLARVERER
jgi:protein phosphatase